MVCAFGETSDTYGVRLCIMVRWHTLGKARSHRLWLTKSKTCDKGPGSDREGEKRTALVWGTPREHSELNANGYCPGACGCVYADCIWLKEGSHRKGALRHYLYSTNMPPIFTAVFSYKSFPIRESIIDAKIYNKESILRW